jgi:UDP-glucose 4-epimerase
MENFFKKSVLISGGLGYLGGRISQLLLNAGFNVEIATSRHDVVVPDILGGCGLRYINLEDFESLKKATTGIDVVIHLAAMDSNSCSKNPEKSLLVNVLGTLNFLKAAKASKVKTFIYSSTVHVYGSPLQGEINELTLPRPSHDYSITHRAAEDYVLKESESTGLKGIVLRFSNIVGSPLTKDVNCWDLVVHDLCRQSIMNKRMCLLSNNSILRDYLPISDVSTIILNIISKPNIFKITSGSIINITKGKSLTLIEVASLVAARCKILFGFRPVIVSNEDGQKTKQRLLISNQTAVDIGFNFNSSLSSEVDSILVKSKEWFVENS